MLQVGLAGIGFMGMIHYLAYRQVAGAKVVAIGSRDPKKLAGDWRGIQGNFGPSGEQMDLTGIACYSELDELLADPAVQLVDICLPPWLHADATIAALQAGKHVFCEKPISVSLEDADRMIAAAKQAEKQLLIGHVLPLLPEFRFAYDTVRSGKYGRLLGGHFKRLISDPHWLPDYYDPKRIGGPLIDLHIHDAHLIRLLCGMPRAVFSQGRMRGEVAELVETQFLFDDPRLVVSATGGVIHQPGRSFTHAFEIYCENATLLFDFAVIDNQPRTLMPLTVLTGDKSIQPELPPSDPIDGFVAELTEVCRAIDEHRPTTILSATLARDALALCHAETESVRTKRPVELASA